MSTTTISSKGQVVIPRHLREKHRLTPGVRLHVEETRNGLVLSRAAPASTSRKGGWRALRGCAKGTGALRAHLAEHRREARR
jgi:AbrB family looped-hinge helix DNA binding protein